MGALSFSVLICVSMPVVSSAGQHTHHAAPLTEHTSHLQTLTQATVFLPVTVTTVFAILVALFVFLTPYATLVGGVVPELPYRKREYTCSHSPRSPPSAP